jgi:glycerol-3-phosphate dehydrogenase
LLIQGNTDPNYSSIHRGSAIAKIVGVNAKNLPQYDDRVTMYVFEEMIDGKKLTEIINTTHENVKYLPGHKLPENVVSNHTIFYDALLHKPTMY